jgi:hypothetical protein
MPSPHQYGEWPCDGLSDYQCEKCRHVPIAPERVVQKENASVSPVNPIRTVACERPTVTRPDTPSNQ